MNGRQLAPQVHADTADSAVHSLEPSRVIQEGGGSRIGEQALGGDRIIKRVESGQSSERLEVSESRVSCDP
jgi:hypothetical protein